MSNVAINAKNYTIKVFKNLPNFDICKYIKFGRFFFIIKFVFFFAGTEEFDAQRNN